ncbi:unnamed protein product, partial [Ectocarpus sp. 8 AP-2014]
MKRKRPNLSPAVQQRKRWYGTRRWRKLRAQVLAGNPLCAICWKVPATQADHIQHTDDNAHFWNPNNLRPACAECNNRLGATDAAKRRR